MNQLMGNHGLRTFDCTESSVLAQLLIGFVELSFWWIQFASLLLCASSILI